MKEEIKQTSNKNHHLLTAVENVNVKPLLDNLNKQGIISNKSTSESGSDAENIFICLENECEKVEEPY